MASASAGRIKPIGTRAIAETMMSSARFITCLPPSYVGICTWISGRPSTGANEMRGPATSVRRLESTSSAAAPSSCQLKCLTKSSSPSGWLATMIVSAPSSPATVATVRELPSTGKRMPSTSMSRALPSSRVAPTTW